MISQLMSDNRDLWFLAKDGWREMSCPVSKRKLILLLPDTDNEPSNGFDFLKEWAREISETLVVYVRNPQAPAADEKAQLASLRRLNAQANLNLDSLDLGCPIRTAEIYVDALDARSIQKQIEEELRFELDARSIVIAPRFGGGVDSCDAVGRCAKNLAAKIGFEIHYYPVGHEHAQPMTANFIPEEFLRHYKSLPFEVSVH